MLGISHSRLSDYEVGVTHGTERSAIPSRGMLVKMAELYGTSPDIFFGLAGLPLTEPPIPSPEEVEEIELLEIFRSIPNNQRKLFMGLARVFQRDG